MAKEGSGPEKELRWRETAESWEREFRSPGRTPERDFPARLMEVTRLEESQRISFQEQKELEVVQPAGVGVTAAASFCITAASSAAARERRRRRRREKMRGPIGERIEREDEEDEVNECVVAET